MTESKQAENPGGMTDLHRAASHGNQEEVTRLLAEGVIDPNQLNLAGQPALFKALELSMAEGPEARPGREAIFRQLWDVTRPEVRLVQDKRGNTALQLMAVRGFDELTRWLLAEAPELAKKPMKYSDEYPIHSAILNTRLDPAANFEVTKALFELDPDTATYKTAKQQTPLHYAVCHGSDEMVQYCCDGRFGDDIDATDREGMTALAFAKVNDNTVAEGYLLAAGADESKIDLSAITHVSHP
ncbi:MAG: ankyrin repeat domain-containing protein [Gammaproteobacteria bacterium]|nr:ankyrin repeat domain-containing protein [Gammaproteobacteria bacterium]